MTQTFHFRREFNSILLVKSFESMNEKNSEVFDTK